MLIKDLIYNPNEFIFKREQNPEIYDTIDEHMKSLKYGDIIRKMDDGVYQYWDFNEIHLPDYMFESYFKAKLWDDDEFPYMDFYGYGVCDNYQQVFDRDENVRKWVDDPDKKFVLQMCYVSKKSQPEWGGWRWHKWGEYIGDQKPKCEYLHDEPDIEGVFCYRLLRIVKEPEINILKSE